MYYVYLHINETGVFYAGCGKKGRPWKHSNRSNTWKQFSISGYSVLLVGEFSNQQEAWEHEKKLISHFKPPCNKALGGYGASGVVRTSETLGKMRLAQRGAGNPFHKLTEAQVLAIRSNPNRHQDIADEYGVATSAISKIKTRQRWAHLI